MTNYNIKLRYVNIICIIVLVFISYIASEYKYYSSHNDKCGDYKVYKKILYSQVESDIKTGDLIFFDHNLSSIHERTFGNRQFSHVGIIIIINNVPHVYEMCPYDVEFDKLHNSSSVKLAPLYNRILNYAGDSFLVSLTYAINKYKEYEILSNINNRKYSYLSDHKILLSFLINSTAPDRHSKICSEFVAEILDALEITVDMSYSKKKNITQRIIDLSNGKLYRNPVHIIMDELMVTDLNSKYTIKNN